MGVPPTSDFPPESWAASLAAAAIKKGVGNCLWGSLAEPAGSLVTLQLRIIMRPLEPRTNILGNERWKNEMRCKRSAGRRQSTLEYGGGSSRKAGLYLFSSLVFFFWCWRPHLAVLGSNSWLCAGDQCLEGLVQIFCSRATSGSARG